MYLLKKAQIAHLKLDNAPTKVSIEYTDFVDIISPKLTIEFSKNTSINNYAIKFMDDWQSSYNPIYSLSPIELETLKAYIKNNLINRFIRYSKSLIGAPIFFNKRSDRKLRLCIDYQNLNNLTIKNRYPLFLVKELLDWLNRAWYFI